MYLFFVQHTPGIRQLFTEVHKMSQPSDRFVLPRKGNKMSNTALIIKADFAVEETGTALGDLQKAVDGWIEAIDLNNDLTMWVNEEYLLRNELVVNPMASALFASIGGQQPIFGDVVITGGTDPEGYTTGLTEVPLKDLKSMVEHGQKIFEVVD